MHKLIISKGCATLDGKNIVRRCACTLGYIVDGEFDIDAREYNKLIRFESKWDNTDVKIKKVEQLAKDKTFIKNAERLRALTRRKGKRSEETILLQDEFEDQVLRAFIASGLDNKYLQLFYTEYGNMLLGTGFQFYFKSDIVPVGDTTISHNVEHKGFTGYSMVKALQYLSPIISKDMFTETYQILHNLKKSTGGTVQSNDLKDVYALNSTSENFSPDELDDYFKLDVDAVQRVETDNIEWVDTLNNITTICARSLACIIHPQELKENVKIIVDGGGVGPDPC